MNLLRNPLDVIGASLAHAAYVSLPNRVYEVPDSEVLFKLSSEERAEFRAREAAGEKAIPRKIVTRRPDLQAECEVHAVFAQTWSSTALGAEGAGGRAITSAYTVVVKGPDNVFAVYWNAQFAYLVDLSVVAGNHAAALKAGPGVATVGQAEAFRTDIANRTTVRVGEADERYGARASRG